MIQILFDNINTLFLINLPISIEETSGADLAIPYIIPNLTTTENSVSEIDNEQTVTIGSNENVQVAETDAVGK